MNLLYKKLILTGFLTVIILQLSGCGETVQGISKDTRRVGKGIKTIFTRESGN